MRDFFRELGKRKTGIVAITGTALIFFLVFILNGLEAKFYIYPVILSVAFLTALFIADYLKKKARHREFKRLCVLPYQSVTEDLFSPVTELEEDYVKLLMHVMKEMGGVITEFEKKEIDTADYYSMWVHQIKTPIASMNLKLKSMDSPDARKLLSDLTSIENYVDMVMSYLRLNSEHTDYVFKDENIKDMLRQSVKKFSTDFIERKLSMEFEVQDCLVYTDRKWVSIVFEQIISNALKYTRSGGIKISFFEESNMLAIKDTGIGIDSTELPRIFERGYTGFNGRGEAHSSGIGLFIAKKICDNLGIGIRCVSKVNEGTTMYLYFPKKNDHFE